MGLGLTVGYSAMGLGLTNSTWLEYSVHLTEERILLLPRSNTATQRHRGGEAERQMCCDLRERGGGGGLALDGGYRHGQAGHIW